MRYACRTYLRDVFSDYKEKTVKTWDEFLFHIIFPVQATVFTLTNQLYMHTYTAVQPTCSNMYKRLVLINTHHTRGLWLVSPAAHCSYLLTTADSRTGGCLSRDSWFSSTPGSVPMFWERKALFSRHTTCTHHPPGFGFTRARNPDHVTHYIVRDVISRPRSFYRVTTNNLMQVKSLLVRGNEGTQSIRR